MKQKFDVTGMTCSACSSRVEKAVSKVHGVEKVSVNLLTNSMQVEYDETISSEKIVRAVEEAGYGAKVHNQKKTAEKPVNLAEEEIQSMKKRLIVSFSFLIPLFYISMGHMMGLPLPSFLAGMENALAFAFTQFLLCLPIVYVNRKYYQVGFKTLWHKAPNMDSLIAIGSAAALIYGIYAIYAIGYGLGHMDMEMVSRFHMDLYFESAATILTLITLGKYLETRSKGKTSEAISKLLDLAPKTAVVEENGIEKEVSIDQVKTGDIVIVKPGSTIPVDGVILSGNTTIDESAISGESIPVAKASGDHVLAATINKAGYIRFQATKVGDDTTLAQIIRLVEDASSSKAPIAKMADQVAGIFVPVVIGIAIIATLYWLMAGQSFEFALSIGISVLVISCPCALGLATPVAIMVGTGKGAENGILIKSGEALEMAHAIDTIVLDKTGTITEGKPKVTDILCYKGQANELLKLAASLEKMSEHPLAEAILNKADELKLSLYATSNFEAVFGKGIKAEVNGKIYLAGNEAMMQDYDIITLPYQKQISELANAGKTPLLFADEKELLGIIAVADTIKPTSIAAVSGFKKLGIDVVMLTGDNEKTAVAIQKQVDIPTVYAQVLPQDKEAHIVNLQKAGKKVAMVGDGINDAPSLARADVGIAIGAGTDIAIESADIVLMRSDLLDALTAIKLSKKVILNIKENLFWAFFYNTIGIPLAAGVFYGILGWKLNPMFGAAAMSLSSVCVVSNALRLKFFKVDRERVDTEEVTKETINKGEINMKTLKIEGMMCMHCVKHVEKALNAIEGVKNVVVNLEENEAKVEMEKMIADEVFVEAIEEAGYKVLSIQ